MTASTGVAAQWYSNQPESGAIRAIRAHPSFQQDGMGDTGTALECQVKHIMLACKQDWAQACSYQLPLRWSCQLFLVQPVILGRHSRCCCGKFRCHRLHQHRSNKFRPNGFGQRLKHHSGPRPKPLNLFKVAHPGVSGDEPEFATGSPATGSLGPAASSPATGSPTTGSPTTEAHQPQV